MGDVLGCGFYDFLPYVLIFFCVWLDDGSWEMFAIVGSTIFFSIFFILFFIFFIPFVFGYLFICFYFAV